MPALAKTETATGGEVIQFEEFFRQFYERDFLEAAREGRKAVSIDFSLLDKFDPNLADKLLNDPKNILEAAQLAVQGLDFPEENVKIIPRFKNLPEAAQVRIRDLRAQHIRKFIQVDGIVRRASEVLPEVSIAIFSCPDCGNKISVEQNEKYIKPPAYCDNDSCGYKGKFEQVSAKLIDSRRIVLEEPYETTTGSRSGEVTIYLIEDMTTPEMQRKTDPGNRLKITGIVTERRSIIKGSMKRQLDIFIEANHAESADIEWDEVTISDEDKKKILELAARPDVYDKLVGSLAPSIFGLKEVKEAILLQMFGGVQHILPDKTRIRGDIHILLLGDPSVAKCVTGESEIILADGSIHRIDKIVEEVLEKGKTEIDDGFFARANHDILSLSNSASVDATKATIFWKRKSPEFLYKIETATGRKITATPTHPIFVCENGSVERKPAEILKAGEFLAVPRKLNVSGSQQKISVSIRKSRANNAVRIKIPEKTSPELMRFLGYVLSEGYSQKRGESCMISFTNNSNKLIEDFSICLKNIFGVPVYTRKPHEGKSAKEVYSTASELYSFLEQLSPAVVKRSAGKEIPALIFKCSDEEVRNLVRAFFDGEASVYRDGICVSSASEKMLRQIKTLLLRFEIISYLHPTKVKGKTYWRLFITGPFAKAYGDKIGFSLEYKQSGLDKIKPREGHYTNIDVVPNLSKILISVRKELNMSQFDFEMPRSTYQHFERGDRNPSRSSLQKIAKAFVKKFNEVGKENKELVEKIRRIEMLAGSEIFWDRIKRIEKVKSDVNWVYDLQVDGVHNFIANNFFIHNSQLLKLTSSTIPRGKYASGGGVTGTGLTATVFKDEELGDWVLEAGALVLANKSLMAIDEFDKIDREDLSRLHEALEQQSFPYSFRINVNDRELAIGDFVENLMKENPQKIIEGKDCLILPTHDSDFKVFTTDFEKIYPIKINRISKHAAPKFLMKFKIQNGRELAVTPEHPCWIARDGKITTVAAEKISAGDFFPIPEEIPFEGSEQKFNIQISPAKNSKPIKIPEHNSPEFCRFIGYHITDGGYELNRGKKNGINFYNKDPVLLNDYLQISKSLFGIEPYIYKAKSGVTGIRFISSQIFDFMRQLDAKLIESDFEKRVPPQLMNCMKEDIANLLRALFDGDGTVVRVRRGGIRIALVTPNKELAFQTQELLLRFGIRSSIFPDRKFFKIDISGHENVQKYFENIGFTGKKKMSRLKEYLQKSKTYRSVVNLVPNCTRKLGNILLSLGVNRVAEDIGLYYKNNIHKPRLQKLVLLAIERAEKIESELKGIGRKNFAQMKNIIKKFGISQNEISKELGVSKSLIGYWLRNSKIANTEKLRSALKDILNFKLKSRADLLELKKLAFAPVQWAKVICAEKIKPESGFVYDVTIEPTRAFISNCLVLHNTISIAKASIVATLPAQVSVLAGANPTFGRFDPLKPMAEQTKIPETLLSRFDLKFALRDVPDRERDERLASHILETRLHPEKIEPEISTDLLRKYIAYARKFCKPQMTRDAVEMLKKFYLDMRAMSGGSGTIAITLRQNEALMRLSEASAKIRLGENVEVADAERAIHIMKESLRQLAFDAETGRIDIDRVEGITPGSQRQKIHNIIDIIERLSKQIGKQVPREEILAVAQDEGIKEDEADELLNRLKREGIIFEPKQGFVQKI